MKQKSKIIIAVHTELLHNEALWRRRKKNFTEAPRGPAPPTQWDSLRVPQP